MKKNISKYYNLGLITLLAFILVNLVTMPIVNATEYIDSNTIEQGISADAGIVPYTRGSCTELVRAGLKSPRTCGYIQGRPKAGNIWVNKAQAACIRKFYESAAGALVSIPLTYGGGAFLLYSTYTTFTACRGV